jgi:hypothetical protein
MSYKRQTTFNPDDDIPTLIEKITQEFTAIERSHGKQQTTIVQGGSVSRAGGSGGGSSARLTIRTLDGSLVLDATELVVDTTVALLLTALSANSAKLAFPADPALVGVQLTGRIQQNAIIAVPTTPSADVAKVYLRKIVGSPNELRFVLLDENGIETIIASYLIA